MQGVISLRFFYFTKSSFAINPFNIDINYDDSKESNNYFGLFISLGVIVFVCLICSFFFYKCSRIFIENANRRLDQRRTRISQISLNRNLPQEDDIRKSNQEILNKILETDLKPIKYIDQINHFNTNCTICLEEFNQTTEVIYLFCKHIFHYECLKDWLNKNILMPKCPNCNYNVLTGGEINLNNHNANNLHENNGDNNRLHSSVNNNDMNNQNNNYLRINPNPIVERRNEILNLNNNLNNTLNAISHHNILTNENNNNSQVIVHKINVASNINRIETQKSKNVNHNNYIDENQHLENANIINIQQYDSNEYLNDNLDPSVLENKKKIKGAIKLDSDKREKKKVEIENNNLNLVSYQKVENHDNL